MNSLKERGPYSHTLWPIWISIRKTRRVLLTPQAENCPGRFGNFIEGFIGETIPYGKVTSNDRNHPEPYSAGFRLSAATVRFHSRFLIQWETAPNIAADERASAWRWLIVSCGQPAASS